MSQLEILQDHNGEEANFASEQALEDYNHEASMPSDEQNKKIPDLKRLALEASIKSTPDYIDVIEDEEEILPVCYLSDIAILSYQPNENFSIIIPKIAQAFKLNVSEFLLWRGKTIIKIEDTPECLKMDKAEVLICTPYKAHENLETDYDVNSIKLIFQRYDIITRTEILVHKLQKMQDIMEKYSKIVNIPLDQLLFEFYGEKIDGLKTPYQMKFDSGCCIDVTHVSSKPSEARC